MFFRKFSIDFGFMQMETTKHCAKTVWNVNRYHREAGAENAAFDCCARFGRFLDKSLSRALNVPAEACPDAGGYVEIIGWGTALVFVYYR